MGAEGFLSQPVFDWSSAMHRTGEQKNVALQEDFCYYIISAG